ncbi:MAG: metallophosphoesterase [Sphaerochaeta sp.]|jgi:Icc-related predicted phosphoesterase
MKILCVSDATDPLVYSQNIASRYEDVDLVIAAGDLPLHYHEFIISSLNKPLYFVFGNHNLEHLSHYVKNDESLPTGHAIISDTNGHMPPFSGEFIDGKVRRDRKSGLIIAGLGGSMRYNTGAHQFSERQMFFRMLRMVPRLLFNRIFHGRYLDILVTHAAPLGIGDDTDLCHIGFATFLTFMERFKPKYLLHGHIHLVDLNANRHHVYKQTQIINIYNSYILEDPQLGRRARRGT